MVSDILHRTIYSNLNKDNADIKHNIGSAHCVFCRRVTVVDIRSIVNTTHIAYTQNRQQVIIQHLLITAMPTCNEFFGNVSK